MPFKMHSRLGRACTGFTGSLHARVLCRANQTSTYLNTARLTCSFFRAWLRVMYCTAFPACPCTSTGLTQRPWEHKRY